MIEARYDLKYQIAGHDFYSWLVVAKGKGIDRIVFGIKEIKETKWPKETVLERFRSIMEPGPALVGIEYRIGDGGMLGIASPHMMDLVPYVKSGGKIARIRSPIVERSSWANYTVTIRHEPRIPLMNSNIDDWVRFAEKIGATIIQDYNDLPVPLQKRIAVYAGAKMNFGVVNGPMHLLGLSEYPVTIFKANVSASNLSKHGIPFGTQLPWARENQRLVWEDDNYDNLMRNFEAQFGAFA